MQIVLKPLILGLVVLGAAVAAFAWYVADEAPRPPEFDQTFAPRTAIVGPRTWNGKVESTCPLPATPASGPAICVAATDKPIYGRGDGIKTRISWRGVPAGSSFVVYLVRDQPEKKMGEYGYTGPTGPLILQSIVASGDGSADFAWNGREFACAPADLPMMCKQTPDIGRYRIGVILYARSQVVIVGWPDRDPPAVLALSTSPTFVVRGTPDLTSIARALWWAAMDQAMAQREIAASNTLVGDMSGRGLDLYQRGDRICAKIPAHPPYQSTLEACAPKAKILGDAGLTSIPKTDITVTGHVTVTTGLLSRERSITLAQAVADKPYIPRVAFLRQPSMEQAGYDRNRDGDDFTAWSRANPRASTYLNDEASRTFYRADLGGGWAIVLNEIMSGGSLPDGERFADKVLVFVSGAGKACVIETRKYRGEEFAQNPETGKFACP